MTTEIEFGGILILLILLNFQLECLNDVLKTLCAYLLLGEQDAEEGE